LIKGENKKGGFDKGENKIPPIPPLLKGGIKWGDLERKNVKI